MKNNTKRANDKQVGGTHYKDMGIEPWDVVDTWPIEMRVGAYRAGALKYLMRMGSKDESAQEIGKGIHYMEKLQEVVSSTEYRIQQLVNDGPTQGVGSSKTNVVRQSTSNRKPSRSTPTTKRRK
jgi:Protein of unknwon function (DUF3310)